MTDFEKEYREMRGFASLLYIQGKDQPLISGRFLLLWISLWTFHIFANYLFICFEMQEKQKYEAKNVTYSASRGFSEVKRSRSYRYLNLSGYGLSATDLSLGYQGLRKEWLLMSLQLCSADKASRMSLHTTSKKNLCTSDALFSLKRRVAFKCL